MTVSTCNLFIYEGTVSVFASLKYTGGSAASTLGW